MKLVRRYSDRVEDDEDPIVFIIFSLVYFSFITLLLAQLFS
jgi:hypothetical protein